MLFKSAFVTLKFSNLSSKYVFKLLGLKQNNGSYDEPQHPVIRTWRF